MTWIDDSKNNDGRPAFLHDIHLADEPVASVEYYEIADGAWQVLVRIMGALALPSRKMSHEDAREVAVRVVQALRAMWRTE